MAWFNYKYADEQLQGRCKDSRKVANNTYLKRHNDYISVLLHSTEILHFYPDGRIRVNMGGWESVTTRARMNDFGVRTYTQRTSRDSGSRTIIRVGSQEWEYSQGMMLHPDGTVTGAEVFEPETEKAQRKAERLVESARLRAIRKAAEKVFRKAKLKQQPVTAQLQRAYGGDVIQLRAWVSDKLCVHPEVTPSGRVKWDGLFCIRHVASGENLYAAMGAEYAVVMVKRLERVADTITAWATLKRIGVDPEALGHLRAQIVEHLEDKPRAKAEHAA